MECAFEHAAVAMQASLQTSKWRAGMRNMSFADRHAEAVYKAAEGTLLFVVHQGLETPEVTGGGRIEKPASLVKKFGFCPSRVCHSRTEHSMQVCFGGETISTVFCRSFQTLGHTCQAADVA